MCSNCKIIYGARPRVRPRPGGTCSSACWRHRARSRRSAVPARACTRTLTVPAECAGARTVSLVLETTCSDPPVAPPTPLCRRRASRPPCQASPAPRSSSGGRGRLLRRFDRIAAPLAPEIVRQRARNGAGAAGPEVRGSGCRVRRRRPWLSRPTPAPRSRRPVVDRGRRAHGGTVVKGLGDGLMATFESAADAVEDRAVEVQCSACRPSTEHRQSLTHSSPRPPRSPA